MDYANFTPQTIIWRASREVIVRVVASITAPTAGGRPFVSQTDIELITGSVCATLDEVWLSRLTATVTADGVVSSPIEDLPRNIVELQAYMRGRLDDPANIASGWSLGQPVVFTIGSGSDANRRCQQPPAIHPLMLWSLMRVEEHIASGLCPDTSSAKSLIYTRLRDLVRSLQNEVLVPFALRI